MKNLILLLLLGGALAVSGCTKSTATPIPGSANTFDSQSYATLVTIDSVIESTKTSLTTNQFPASIAPSIKAALNVLIQSYDVANPVYVAYHTSALAGKATAAQQAAVSNALSDVNAKLAALTAAKGAK